MKKIILGVIAVIIIFLDYTFFSRKENNIAPAPDTNQITEENKNLIDLNGDGEKEHLVLEMPEEDGNNYLKSIKAYNRAGEEIASLPSEITIKVPISDSLQIYKLDKNSPKEFFRLDFGAGPHQSETMFFALHEDFLLPVCHEKEVTGPYDCLFYSGNTGYLPVKDLDGDGYVEVMETVDEYPASGELSLEEASVINKQGVDDFAQGIEIIAKREKGGRGRSVVWAIYSFNGKKFVKQSGNDYEKFYSLIGDLIENKMRKSDLSENSLEYIQFVKDFWSHKINR